MVVSDERLGCCGVGGKRMNRTEGVRERVRGVGNLFLEPSLHWARHKFGWRKKSLLYIHTSLHEVKSNTMRIPPTAPA